MTAAAQPSDLMTRLAAIRPAELLTPVTIALITAALILMPAERSGWNWVGVLNFLTIFAIFVAIYGIIALGLNVHWGYTGIFNFGVMAYFLVGAYTAAIVTKNPDNSDFSNYVGGFGNRLDFIPFAASDQWLPFIIGTLTAAVACGVLAFFLSIPALRLREDYLAIATIGIAELVRRITIEERDFVNGTRGLAAIPRPFGDLIAPEDFKFVMLGIAVITLVLVYFALERGIRSPWGRVLRALREDELATSASGKNVFAFKSQAFVLGAMIMGVGGSLYAYANGAVSPTTFSHFFGTFIFWGMLIVGGSGNNKGAILGAYAVWGFWNITLQLQGYDLPRVIDARIAFVRELILGSLIVIVLLLRPQGLVPEQRRVSIWVERAIRGRPPPEKRGPEPE